MSKALVLIGNNLKYDTRVKRHIQSIAEVMDSVYVLARPIPDEQFHLSIPNVSHSFFHYLPQSHPINEEILNFADQYELREAVLACFPILECETYYNLPDLERYTDIISKYVAGERWRDITNRKSEEMDIYDALSYPLTFFESSVQYAIRALEVEADVVFCNDVDTLFAGVIHKLHHGSRLVYDFHDIVADITENLFPQIYSNVLVLFEKSFIQYADIVISVCRSFLEWSKKHYAFQAPAIPILNCSDTKSMSRWFGWKRIPRDKIRLYYHGMSDASRGLFELVHAAERFEEYQVVLRCLPSENLEKLKAEVEKKGLGDKVIFLEPVLPSEIPEAAHRDGDIGFHMCRTDTCINWRMALTNKFIEYTKAGLPIITSDTEEQGNIIRQYKNGWILEGNTEEAIMAVLERIKENLKSIPGMSRRSLKAAKKLFSWKKYDLILKGIAQNDQTIICQNQIYVSLDQEQLERWDIEDRKNILEASDNFGNIIYEERPDYES